MNNRKKNAGSKSTAKSALRSRTGEKTTNRGSIALEDTVWEFVKRVRKRTGLSKNAILRKALYALMEAEEGDAAASPGEQASNRNPTSKVTYVIAKEETLFDKLERILPLKKAKDAPIKEFDAPRNYTRAVDEVIPTLVRLLELAIDAGILEVAIADDEVGGQKYYHDLLVAVLDRWDKSTLCIHAK